MGSGNTATNNTNNNSSNTHQQQQMTRRHDVKKPAKKLIVAKSVKSTMELLDEDKDGKLNVKEIENAAMKFVPDQSEKLMEYFYTEKRVESNKDGHAATIVTNKFDQDGDSMISLEEL